METSDAEQALREAPSRVQREAERRLDDSAVYADETSKELCTKAQQVYTEFTDVLRDATIARPLRSLAIAAAVGALLGALRAAGRTR